METSFTRARAEFAKLCQQASDDREVVYIRRRNAPDVALIDADELRALLETDYLLRSPANAERLQRAIARAEDDGGQEMSPGDLRKNLGLD